MSTPIEKKTEEERSVEFVPFGASDKIRLTASMVRQFIAVPTRSGKLPSERDCIRFIMLCRGKRANPFEGDCFLIGYDSKDGATFSLVCGIELFLKRAEQSEDYDGRESGVIVLDSDKTIHERVGSLVLDGEKLVGGWARVYRKDHSHPDYKAVKFATYDTGRSRWEKDPGGQIEKVALSQALRSAFPTALGALYTQEEMERITEVGNGTTEREPIPMPRALPAADSKTKPKAVTKKKEEPAAMDTDPAFVADTPQKTLAKQLAEAGVTEAAFITELRGYGINADTIMGLSDDHAEKALFEFSGIVKEIKESGL